MLPVMWYGDLISEVCLSLFQLQWKLSEDEIRTRENEEQSIIYSQALHYTDIMVCMRTPLDVSRLRHVNISELEERSRMSGDNR
jgi:hypothetical protein